MEYIFIVKCPFCMGVNLRVDQSGIECRDCHGSMRAKPDDNLVSLVKRWNTRSENPEDSISTYDIQNPNKNSDYTITTQAGSLLGFLYEVKNPRSLTL